MSPVPTRYKELIMKTLAPFTVVDEPAVTIVTVPFTQVYALIRILETMTAEQRDIAIRAAFLMAD